MALGSLKVWEGNLEVAGGLWNQWEPAPSWGRAQLRVVYGDTERRRACISWQGWDPSSDSKPGPRRGNCNRRPQIHVSGCRFRQRNHKGEFIMLPLWTTAHRFHEVLLTTHQRGTELKSRRWLQKKKTKNLKEEKLITKILEVFDQMKENPNLY